MTDDLNDLKQALNAATPAPDPAARAANLALAQKNFEDLQGSRNGARHTSNRPTRGFWTGALKMLNSLTSRAALTATTAVVAIGFVMLTPLGSDLLSPPKPFAPKPLITSAPEEFEVAPAPQSEDIADKSRQERTREPARTGEGKAAKEADADFSESLSQDGFYSQGAVASIPVSPSQQPAPALGRLAEQLSDMAVVSPESNTEAFANAAANPLHITAETPVSTFSIDVDTASYSVIRNSLMNGQLPDPQSVRIEEMINYFPYAYPAPDGAAFQPTVSVSATPWNPDTRLVHIGIQGALPDIEDRPPLNLVFLIDTSGSMNEPNKLPLLKQSFRLLLGQLRPSDQVSIVTYAGSAGQVLEPTNASERSTILRALERLQSGGSTAGQAGLQQAYATAAAMTEEGEVTRVILATDGDFNVGISNPEALKTYIADKRDSGTYLSVLGFGRGNLDDATMQALAQNGNGQAAYIDTLAEAQKVLVDQLTGALFPIADDVKIQVEFNPAQIAEYRLIGYETRTLRREDFNNDAVDAGDIGAGHTVTALYEVTPVGSPAQLSTPLRYQPADNADAGDELGFLALRYKAPGAATSQLIETPITQDMAPLPDAGFATAIAGFGQLLRGSNYVTDWTYQDAIALASETKGDDPYGYRAEAIQLMRLAASLSEN
jgi:Ca-activated chloride channel family protein